MKFLLQIAAVTFMMAFTSGCSAPQLKAIDGVDGGVCNNPKCQCPKPCQCGAGCQCGMNGNSTELKK
jgi:hypothetical protein